jgi:hypothetical protein
MLVPPEASINVDFLKQVLKDEKLLMPLSQVKTIQVPFYDEISVQTLWPMMK